MRKGDKVLCIEDITNPFGWKLFEKGTIYEVLYIDNEDTHIMVTLNHKLYGNEYNSFSLEWIKEKFKKL